MLKRPLVSAIAAVSVLVIACDPGAPHPHRRHRRGRAAALDRDVVKTYDRMQAAFPGEQFSADVACRATTSTRTRSRRLRSSCGRSRRELGSVQRARSRSSPRRQGRRDRGAAGGQRQRRHLAERGEDAAQRRRARGAASGQRRRAGGRVRLQRRVARLQRGDGVTHLVRVRLRLLGGVPAAAGDVPLDRHPDQGDRAEHPVGGGRDGDRDLRVPGRLLRGPLRTSTRPGRSRPGSR